jgi:hypothetical protein
MQDELFRPTMGGRTASGGWPWRHLSIVYPAYLAGPLTAAVLGVVNGRRLGLTTRRLAVAAVAGLSALAGRMAFSPRAGALAGVLVWLLVLELPRTPFRAFLRDPGRPTSPAVPALAVGFVR